MRRFWPFLLICCLCTTLAAFDEAFEKKYNLRSIKDAQNGIIWYKHKKGTQGGVKIYPYIGKRIASGQVFLRMVIIFYGYDNLFVREYVLTVDDEEYVITPRKTIETIEMRDSHMRMDRSASANQRKGICEVYDIDASLQEYEMMEKISRAKTVKLRYNGVKGHTKAPVHKQTKKAMQDVLAAYRELAGIPDPQK
jgi:hypothetical protein